MSCRISSPYGEIAPLHILLCSTRVHNAVRVPSIGVADVGAKRGHLHLEPIALYGNHAELRPHAHALRKKRHHLIGSRIRSDVVIRGFAPQQNVAHTAARQQRFMPMAAQSFAN